jgi:putative addiction module component (TIGR02574 family)
MSVSLEQIGIAHLDSTERLELIGLIWDSILESETSLPLPEWHLRELERRRANAEASPEAGIPWEVVKDRLSNTT